jgi:hypothetical protein
MSRVLLAGMLSVAVAGSTAAQGGDLTGYWRGTYGCPQGLTGVSLTIRQRFGSAVDAVFHFYAVPQNPGVPTGCFRMQGRLGADTQEFSLTSDNGQWIVRPYNYIVVNFHGRLSGDGSSMRGRVEGPGCSDFDLQRLDEPAVGPAACSELLG